jgi:hypothetical protein
MRWRHAFGRKQRKLCKLTEWQIQRKLERFKLHQVQNRLDGLQWKAKFTTERSPDSEELNNLETLLRAGVRQSQRVMNGLCLQSPCEKFVSELVASAQRREEQGVSYRQEYARKFYGVKS